jgi:hypothetical protein
MYNPESEIFAQFFITVLAHFTTHNKVNICISTVKNKGRGDGYTNVIQIVFRNSAAGGSVCDVTALWTEPTTNS